MSAAPDYYFLAESMSAAAGPGATPGGLGGADPGTAVTVPSWNFDVDTVRKDFPVLQERVNGHPLVFLDNAATTQKPQPVIDRLSYFYSHENSNIHRGAHELAARATDAFEDARKTTARFLGASSPEEIIFTRGTTEAINLAAGSWGRQHIKEGDEIVLTHLEHHANIVPWKMLADDVGAKLKVAPVDDTGQLILSEYQKLLTDKTMLVACTHVCNALGTVPPVTEVIRLAHEAGAKALIDGAQSVSHLPVDVTALDADFYAFSGHKVFGPTGIGVLYGKSGILSETQPWQGGGNMIKDVTFERVVYNDLPARFEAGTASIADAVGLGTALDYVDKLGRPAIAAYEHELLEYGTGCLQAVPGLHLIGTAPDKAGVLSFTLDGYQPQEVGRLLNQAGVAVRAGHHCAQPILRRFGVEETVRAAIAMYNTRAEIDTLAGVLLRLARRARLG